MKTKVDAIAKDWPSTKQCMNFKAVSHGSHALLSVSVCYWHCDRCIPVCLQPPLCVSLHAEPTMRLGFPFLTTACSMAAGNGREGHTRYAMPTGPASRAPVKSSGTTCVALHTKQGLRWMALTRSPRYDIGSRVPPPLLLLTTHAHHTHTRACVCKRVCASLIPLAAHVLHCLQGA